MTDFTEMQIDDIIKVMDAILKRQILESQNEGKFISIKEIKEKFGDNAYWSFHMYCRGGKAFARELRKDNTKDNDINNTLALEQEGIRELVNLKKYKADRELSEKQIEQNKTMIKANVGLSKASKYQFFATCLFIAVTLFVGYLSTTTVFDSTRLAFELNEPYLAPLEATVNSVWIDDTNIVHDFEFNWYDDKPNKNEITLCFYNKGKSPTGAINAEVVEEDFLGYIYIPNIPGGETNCSKTNLISVYRHPDNGYPELMEREIEPGSRNATIEIECRFCQPDQIFNRTFCMYICSEDDDCSTLLYDDPEFYNC